MHFLQLKKADKAEVKSLLRLAPKKLLDEYDGEETR
jgi:hypothetical protein